MKFRTQLRLEALDGRIVPTVTPTHAVNALFVDDGTLSGKPDIRNASPDDVGGVVYYGSGTAAGGGGTAATRPVGATLAIFVDDGTISDRPDIGNAPANADASVARYDGDAANATDEDFEDGEFDDFFYYDEFYDDDFFTDVSTDAPEEPGDPSWRIERADPDFAYGVPFLVGSGLGGLFDGARNVFYLPLRRSVQALGDWDHLLFGPDDYVPNNEHLAGYVRGDRSGAGATFDVALDSLSFVPLLAGGRRVVGGASNAIRAADQAALAEARAVRVIGETRQGLAAADEAAAARRTTDDIRAALLGPRATPGTAPRTAADDLRDAFLGPRTRPDARELEALLLRPRVTPSAGIDPATLGMIRDQGILDLLNNKPSLQAELFQRELNAIQFGQKRIGESFRIYSEAPDFIRGRLVADVAADLRAGRISPDSLPVYYFEYQGQLVAINNRGLAALAEAGMRPTVIRKVPLEQLDPKVLKRLAETPLLRGQTIPGPMIPVTVDEAGTQIIRIIELPQ